jgi:hypothetical protein
MGLSGTRVPDFRFHFGSRQFYRVGEYQMSQSKAALSKGPAGSRAGSAALPVGPAGSGDGSAARQDLRSPARPVPQTADDDTMVAMYVRMWSLATGRRLKPGVRLDQLTAEELIDFWAEDFTQVTGRHAAPEAGPVHAGTAPDAGPAGDGA